jgi:thiol-disulfide isomerase/thioredoxin
MPSPAQTPAQTFAQTPETLRSDIDVQAGLLKDVLNSPTTLTTAAQRTAAAPEAVPALHRIVSDLDALLPADQEHYEEITQRRDEYLMFLSLFGDTDATNRLTSKAASTDPDEALEGKRFQLNVTWLQSTDDAAAQSKVLDEMEKLAKDNPTSNGLATELYGMTIMGPANADLSKRATDILTSNMAGELVDALKSRMHGSQQMAIAWENKPLTIAGKQPDGKDFTTADWKGKVVLVDFWATWCGPCRQELPHVKDMYQKYHAKGLEVLGVSNDYSADELTKFLAENKDLPWPQLFDSTAAAKQQWNPITQGFGIDGIPTMFLIDKKGILRSVTARENMDDLIPKLLAE